MKNKKKLSHNYNIRIFRATDLDAIDHAVFFNGVLEPYCCMADPVNGRLERFVLDEEDKVIYNNEELRKEMIYGVVQVVPMKNIESIGTVMIY